MHTLTQPHPLIQGTIIQNPLYAPTNGLLRAREIRKGFFRTQTVLSTLETDIAQFQSSPGLWCGYDFFLDIHNSKKEVDIGFGFREGVLRLLPEDGSIDALEDFRDAKDVVSTALERSFLIETSYEEALMNIIDIIVTHSTHATEEFDSHMTKQVKNTLQRFYDAGLSERPVLQVNSGSNGDIIAFPRNFFHENSGGNEELGIGDRIRSLLGNIGPRPVFGAKPI